jgi:hypothetical protein
MQLLVVALAPFLLCAADQPVNSTVEQAAEQLNPGLSAAVTGGSWEAAGGRGRYRVVVFTGGFEHVSSKVFLQWLSESEEGPHVLRNVLVAELSSGSWSVGAPVFSGLKRGVIELEATNPYSLESARFALQPQELGKYSIHEVKRKRK